MGDPRVSVVIPTHGRPDLVLRAARSVLAQTMPDLELMVVSDGPDSETSAALRALADPRLIALALPERRGKGAAINAAVARSRARWLAFLDDDDEWLPRKLELQLPVAESAPLAHPIVSCRFTMRSDEGETVWPLRLPEAGEDIGEYTFCQRGPWGGEGMVHPDTILTTRELAVAVPHREELDRHVDVDWLLRAVRHPGVGVFFIAERAPLAIWNTDRTHPRMSHSSDWRYSLQWARGMRDYLTPRAYAAFILIWAGATAAHGRRWRGFLPLLSEAWRHGRPRLRWLGAYFSIWFVPTAARRRLAIALSGRKAG